MDYDSDENYHSLAEHFQSMFKKADEEDEQVCKHESVYRDNSGIVLCSLCKTELESMDYSKREWMYDFSASRCDLRRSKLEGVRNVFERHDLNVSSMMIDIIEAKYQEILKFKCKNRGQIRTSLVASCLFYTYQEFGDYRTLDYIRNLFGLKKRAMTCGLQMYLETFPEMRTNYITPEKLIPWIMRVTGVDESHQRRILSIAKYFGATSQILERGTSGIVAASIVFFYLCMNQEYKNQIGMTKKIFASKVNISGISLIKTVREMADISQCHLSTLPGGNSVSSGTTWSSSRTNPRFDTPSK